MASLRKKYQPQNNPGNDDGPPVLSPPQGGEAKMPEPVADAKPPEPIETESPAELAAKTARLKEMNTLNARLKEMENAETLVRQAQQPPQPADPQELSQEPVDPVEFVLANSGLPERAKAWLRKHPQYVLDQELNAELQHFHYKARKEAEEFSDGYYGVLERHLGLAPATNGQTESKPTPQQANRAPAQVSAPPREPTRVSPRQQYSAPVSAPPTREVPSMKTGRPQSYRAPLSKDELEIAQACGMTADQYQVQKMKMLKMKENNEIQNG